MEKKTGRKNPGNAKTSRYYPLSGGQALQVLALLADKDDGLAEEIAKISAQIYCNVSVEETASSVYRSLDGIAIEDCWDASGRQRGGGYRDEFDVAYDMISEAFSPYLRQIEEFHRLGEYASELTCLHGVVLGLYRFATEPSNDFFDYVEDYPESTAKDMVDDWEKRHPDDTSGLQLLHSFLEEHCPQWNSEPVSISSSMHET